MATWTLDPVHSEVSFKVKHLVISSVTGKFKSFEGTVEADQEDFSDARISFSANVNTVGNPGIVYAANQMAISGSPNLYGSIVAANLNDNAAPGGTNLVASITRASVKALELKQGDMVSAVIKASHVMVGV